jgi:3'(2'), 5'-bisphosphate nucleotidase
MLRSLPSPIADGAYAHEVQFALQAVRQASDLCQGLARYPAAGDPMDKEDRSPVTVADFAAQALVSSELERAFPKDPLVAEEDSSHLRRTSDRSTLLAVTQAVARHLPEATPESVCAWLDRGRGSTADRFWALDPIDGTKGFVRGDQYAIALALIEERQVVLGILGCPRLGPHLTPLKDGVGSVLIAVRGQGAWAASLDTTGGFAGMRVSSQLDPVEARVLRSFEAAHTDVVRLDALLTHLGSRAPVQRMDSQAKYALLAAGRGELIFRLLSPNRPGYAERIWDHAAGALLVEEAGGRVTDLRGAPLDFGAGNTLIHNTGAPASNGLLHDAALRAIQVVGADRRRDPGAPC